MKKVFSIMKIGVRFDDKVTVICEGEQEEEALEEIRGIFEKHL